MSRSTYARLAVVLLLLLAGCGSGAAQSARQPSSPAPARTTSTARWPCLAPLHARETRTTDTLPVALIGSGPRAVVLSNESDQDACGWAAFVPALVRAHFAVALYDFDTDPAGNLAAVVRLVRSRGAKSVALVGASEGAKTSIVAATSTQPAAVVSLSAEAQLRGQDVAPYAKRLTAPTLFVTATDDPYGSSPATRGFYRDAPATTKRLVSVPGTAHGTALLKSPALSRTVVAFLTAHAAKAAATSSPPGWPITRTSGSCCSTGAPTAGRPARSSSRATPGSPRRSSPRSTGPAGTARPG